MDLPLSPAWRADRNAHPTVQLLVEQVAALPSGADVRNVFKLCQ
jgi:hypothetical protein